MPSRELMAEEGVAGGGGEELEEGPEGYRYLGLLLPEGRLDCPPAPDWLPPPSVVAGEAGVMVGGVVLLLLLGLFKPNLSRYRAAEDPKLLEVD